MNVINMYIYIYMCLQRSFTRICATSRHNGGKLCIQYIQNYMCIHADGKSCITYNTVFGSQSVIIVFITLQNQSAPSQMTTYLA
jgi:hypothetical protein